MGSGYSVSLPRLERRGKQNRFEALGTMVWLAKKRRTSAEMNELGEKS